MTQNRWADVISAIRCGNATESVGRRDLEVERHVTRRIQGIAAVLALTCAAFVRPAAARGGDDDARYVAIRCGRVILGTGEEKENVTVLVKNGKVEAIGEKVELPHPCRMVDASKLV